MNETTIKLLAAISSGLIKSLTANELFPFFVIWLLKLQIRNVILSMRSPDAVTLPEKVYDILIGLEHISSS